MLHGHWWIKGNEEKKIPGILDLSGNKIKLEVSGSFSEDDHLANLPDFGEIWGTTFAGKNTNQEESKVANKFVILQNCLKTNHSQSFGNNWLYELTPTGEFTALTMYVAENTDFLKETGLTFHEIRVSFSHLHDFATLQERWIKSKYIPNGEGNLEELQASFKFRTLPTAKIGDAIVEFDQSVRDYGDRQRKYTIEPSIFLRICVPEPLKLQEWYADYITPLQHLMTLSTTQRNRVTSLRAYNNQNINHIQISVGDTITEPIPFEIITAEILEANAIEFSESVFTLFTLDDIQNSFEKAIRSWFTLYKEHRSVQNLLFGVIFADKLYVEDRFLNLARALEVYHRAKYPGGILETNEFKSRRQVIVDQIQEQDLKKWLKDKLAWANELTLNERLVKLFDELADLKLEDKTGLSGIQLSKLIKDGRNHLTHYGSRSKGVSFNKMYWLCYVMEYMLQALLLKELGLRATTVEKDQNYSFRFNQIKKSLLSD
jgi:ApeA N-terminal domain 1